MTAAGSRTRRNKPPRPAGRPARRRLAAAGVRYLLSRRAPAALGLLAGLGALLWGGATSRRKAGADRPDPLHRHRHAQITHLRAHQLIGMNGALAPQAGIRAADVGVTAHAGYVR